MSNTSLLRHPAYRSKSNRSFVLAIFIASLASCLPATNVFGEDAASDQGDTLPAGAIARIGSTGMMHGGAVTKVEFTPNGKQVVSAGRDSSLRFWHLDNSPAGTMPGYGGVMSRVVMVKQQPQLAAVSTDGTLHIIDVAAQSVLRKISNPHGTLRSLELSPNGKFLAGGHSENLIILWNADTGEEIRHWNGHAGWVTALAFSPDSTWLASGGQDYLVQAWDIPSGENRWPGKAHEEWVWGIDVSPDGKQVASASWDNTVGLWNAQEGKLINRMSGHEGRVWTVRFSPDRRRPLLTSGGDDNRLVYWDPLKAKRILAFAQPAWVNAIAFSPDGNRIAFGREDQRVRLGRHHLNRDSNANGETSDIPPEPPRFAAGVFSSKENHVAALYMNLDRRNRAGKLGIHYLDEAATNEHSDQRGISTIDWSHDAALLIYGTEDGHVVGMNTRAGIESREVETKHSGTVTAIASTEIGTWGRVIISAGRDGMICVAKYQTGEELQVLRGHQGWVTSLALVPNTNQLVSAGQDWTVRLWDLESGQLLHTFEGHKNWVRDVDVSTDGKYAATAGLDEAVRLWDLKNKKLVRTLDPKEGEENVTTQMDVYAVAFSLDGKLLATAGEDRVVRFWDLKTGKLKLQRSGHLDRINDLSFSPNGKTIASFSEDGTALVWSVP